MNARLAPCCVILAILFASSTRAADEAGLFPFSVGYDAPRTVVNVSDWLERPAGKHGFVRAVGGHLATDAGPLRLWATNLCFEACFPAKENAEKIAARLAGMGVNCVRMHHMDSRSIWGKSPNKLTIDPEKLDRLDYLVYQLKLHGVYTNLNLHVSRWFDTAEGFTAQKERPNYDKGLDNFEPRMIELQRKYARDLLGHVNPYTKTAYAHEPAIAMVEINNENSLYTTWGGGKIDGLPEPYATSFRKLWNAWLRKKHASTAGLAKAWNAQIEPLGKEMLSNGRFAKPLGDPWSLQRDKQSQAVWSIRNDEPGQSPYLRVEVKQRGETPWLPQIMHLGFSVSKGKRYTLSLRTRSPTKDRLNVNCMQAGAPWKHLGLSGTLETGPQWSTQRFTFVAESDEPQARISIGDFAVGTHDLADVSLRPGGVSGLEPEQRIEDDTVPVLRRRAGSLTAAARADWADFLWDTEHSYWLGMYRFLKDDLKVQSPVSGTQMGYSPPHIQGQLDYIDDHSYWQHPHFPNRPWDSRDWYVGNVALVNSPETGTLTRLAERRVVGLPYTVSEYNHPRPVEYAAEGFPMIAAFGAFQGWDGIFSFAYCHSEYSEPRKLGSYFDIHGDSGKLVHMPACAAMFLRGDVSPARQRLAAAMPAEAERAQLRETLDIRKINAGTFGLPAAWALRHAVGVDLKGPARLPAEGDSPGTKDATRFMSDTGQVVWDVSQPKAGYFTVDTPRTKLFTGFVSGRTFKLGDVTLAIGKTRLDWATVSLVCIDGSGFDRPGRILVAASGLVQNQGAELERLDKDRVTLRNRWGNEPLLCEGVPVQVTLPAKADRVSVYVLDESGKRKSEVAVERRNGKPIVQLDPARKTLWYEVVVGR